MAKLLAVVDLFSFWVLLGRNDVLLVLFGSVIAGEGEGLCGVTSSETQSVEDDNCSDV